MLALPPHARPNAPPPAHSPQPPRKDAGSGRGSAPPRKCHSEHGASQYTALEDPAARRASAPAWITEPDLADPTPTLSEVRGVRGGSTPCGQPGTVGKLVRPASLRSKLLEKFSSLEVHRPTGASRHGRFPVAHASAPCRVAHVHVPINSLPMMSTC